ncbi:EFR1 family ferrodoxin [Clostridium akagii]|uniref:EFR1 family ferrodoxin n=1 Tax=Clostridium akagii TaxID=91623 RepID=UPI00047DDC08|nr:EFR1 family ferrodoxin [Clostridium akagii]
MIFYFSGTGNSLYVAKNIGEHNKEELVSIASAINNKDESYEYTLKDGEIIGFVYPIYAWAPPKMVIQFIKKLKFNNYKNNYIFTVATCGENVGNAIKVISNLLNKKNLTLKSGFSIQMPNNYIISGDVYTKKVEQEKLSQAELVLNKINDVVKNSKDGIFEIEKGFVPGILTSVISPLFNKKGLDTKKFHAGHNCTGCGICESTCNCKNIKVRKKPIWGKKCIQCLACINLCPKRAIQYGKGTEKKGRYKNPNINVKEMMIK